MKIFEKGPSQTENFLQYRLHLTNIVGNHQE